MDRDTLWLIWQWLRARRVAMDRWDWLVGICFLVDFLGGYGGVMAILKPRIFSKHFVFLQISHQINLISRKVISLLYPILSKNIMVLSFENLQVLDWCSFRFAYSGRMIFEIGIRRNGWNISFTCVDSLLSWEQPPPCFKASSYDRIFTLSPPQVMVAPSGHGMAAPWWRGYWVGGLLRRFPSS